MAKPTPDEPRKKQGDKLETLIDETVADESDRKRREAASDDDEDDVDDAEEEE